MARGEDTSHHPSRRVDRASAESRLTQSIKLNPDAAKPLITEKTSPSGERLREIGGYTSYVQTPPGGHKPVEGNYRARRGDYGLG